MASKRNFLCVFVSTSTYSGVGLIPYLSRYQGFQCELTHLKLRASLYQLNTLLPGCQVLSRFQHADNLSTRNTNIWINGLTDRYVPSMPVHSISAVNLSYPSSHGAIKVRHNLPRYSSTHMITGVTYTV